MKWNLDGIIIRKPWEEKSHKLWSKTQNQKIGLKSPHKVAEKNFSGPHIWYIYLSSGYYDHQLSKNNQNEVKWRQLKTWNILWSVDERETLLIGNILWTTGDLNKIIGLMKLVNQSIIRCNYADKFSYWN